MIIDSKEDLPSTWALPCLEAVVELNPKLDKSKIDDDLEVSFVPMPAVEAESGRIDISETKKFAAVKKGYTAFLKSDVLFAKITPCMENGKMAVVPELMNGLGFGSTEFHVLRSCAGISPHYVYYYVSSKLFRLEAERNMTGAVGQRRVPLKWLGKITLPLPPSNEQHRIVAKIEELFSELDKGIESLKKAREQLKVYRQALLKHAFEGKLTEKWRRENADKLESGEELLARIRREREERYRQRVEEWKEEVKRWEAGGKEGKRPRRPKVPTQTTIPMKKQETLADIPSSWRWSRAEELCSEEPYSIGIGPFGSNLKVSDYRSEGVPLVFVKNVTRADFSLDLKYIDTEKFNSLLPHTVKPCDIVITKMGDPPGDCEIYPKNSPVAVLTADCLKFRVWAEFLSVEFFAYSIKSSLIRKQLGLITKGVAQKKISVDRFKSVVFPVPPIAEQNEIVRLMDGKLSVIDSQIDDITDQLTRSQTLRQSILKKAFSGQLVPQDPNDEPASELLRRIAAEKGKMGVGAKRNKRKGVAAGRLTVRRSICGVCCGSW